MCEENRMNPRYQVSFLFISTDLELFCKRASSSKTAQLLVPAQNRGLYGIIQIMDVYEFDRGKLLHNLQEESWSIERPGAAREFNRPMTNLAVSAIVFPFERM